MQEAITTARQRRPFTILGMLIALIVLAAFVVLALRPGSGNGPAIPLTGDKGGTTPSRTVFNNVHVIQVGTTTTTVTPGRNGPTVNRVPGTSQSSLTVVVNECDAEYLTWFLAKANLRYTLENFSDYNKGSANNPQHAAPCPIDAPTGVTNADVAKRFDASLVP